MDHQLHLCFRFLPDLQKRTLPTVTQDMRVAALVLSSVFFLDCPIQSTIKKRGIESFLLFFFSPLHSIINHKSLSQLTPHPYLSASSDPAHFQFNIKLFRRVNKVFPLRCQKERQSRFHFTKCTSSTGNLKIS